MHWDVTYPSGLLSAALDEYGLTGARVEPIRAFNNAVFRVTTPTDDLALRIHRSGYRTSRQIRSELVYLSGLAATGPIEVPTPLPTRHGRLVAEIDAGDEARLCSVITWQPGAVRRPGTGAGQATLSRIGEALGWMHSFSESFTPPSAFERPRWEVGALLDRDASQLARGRHLIDEVHQRSGAALGGIARTPANHGMIHNDLILLNCLHRGRRTAVIDFDDCGWGFYLQDFRGHSRKPQGLPQSPNTLEVVPRRVSVGETASVRAPRGPRADGRPATRRHGAVDDRSRSRAPPAGRTSPRESGLSAGGDRTLSARN